MRTLAATLFAASLAVVLTPPFLLPKADGAWIIRKVSASDSPGTANLVAYWAFEDADGATASDSIGSTNLTEVGSVVRTTGKVAFASDHETSDGSDSWSGGDAAATEFAGDFTITCWVNVETAGSNRGIASKYVTTGDQREYGMLYDNAATAIRVVLSSDGTSANTTSLTSGTTISTGTWYFVTFYHDDGVGIGVSINAGTFDTAAHTGGTFNGTASFLIGDYIGASWDGQLDEFAMWNRVLTQDEIDWLYNSGSGRAFGDL